MTQLFSVVQWWCSRCIVCLKISSTSISSELFQMSLTIGITSVQLQTKDIPGFRKTTANLCLYGKSWNLKWCNGTKHRCFQTLWFDTNVTEFSEHISAPLKPRASVWDWHIGWVYHLIPHPSRDHPQIPRLFKMPQYIPVLGGLYKRKDKNL